MSDLALQSSSEDQQRTRALHIYQELHTLAHLPEYAVCIGTDTHTLQYADGRHIQMEFSKKPGDGYEIPRLGFLPEQWESGVIEFRHESLDRKMERAVKLSLFPSGLIARSMSVPHQGEQVAIEAIEIAFLNAFSLLSLIPSYILKEYGTFRKFEQLLVGTDPDMTGITLPGQIQGRFRYPLFVEGLHLYLVDYQSNRAGTRDNLDAFRTYIQRSDVIRLPNIIKVMS